MLSFKGVLKSMTIVAFSVALLAGCQPLSSIISTTERSTVRSNSSYTVTKMAQYKDKDDDLGTYFTGASDGSQNTFHAFVLNGKVIWTPHLPADAVREFKDIISLLLQSDELEASAELSATFENMAKSIANRTENVEMLRYSLYTLSLLAINEDLTKAETINLFNKVIDTFGNQSQEN